MIYGRQSVDDESTDQPAGLPVGQALLVSFHAPRQSMQELSSLGRSAVRVLCVALLLAINFSRRSGDREKLGRERKTGKRGGKKMEEEGCGEVRDKGKNGTSY